MYCIALLNVFCLVRQVKVLTSDLVSVLPTVSVQILHNCFQLEDGLMYNGFLSPKLDWKVVFRVLLHGWIGYPSLWYRNVHQRQGRKGGSNMICSCVSAKALYLQPFGCLDLSSLPVCTWIFMQRGPHRRQGHALTQTTKNPKLFLPKKSTVV